MVNSDERCGVNAVEILTGYSQLRISVGKTPLNSGLAGSMHLAQSSVPLNAVLCLRRAQELPTPGHYPSGSKYWQTAKWRWWAQASTCNSIHSNRCEIFNNFSPRNGSFATYGSFQTFSPYAEHNMLM